jgi:hypothetical protein
MSSEEIPTLFDEALEAMGELMTALVERECRQKRIKSSNAKADIRERVYEEIGYNNLTGAYDELS